MINHQIHLNFILCIFGLLGVVFNRTNFLFLLISLEVAFLGINLNFIVFSCIFNDLQGQLIVLFILTIIGAESAVGLAILIVYYRVRGQIQAFQSVAIRN